MLRTIPNGEKFSTSTTYSTDADEATAIFTVRADKNGVRSVVSAAVFNFEGCDRADLVKLAMKSIVITEQSRYRTMKDTVKRGKSETWERGHNVKAEFVDVARSKKSDTEKVLAFMGGMGEAEKAALIKMLNEVEAGE